MCQSSPQFFKVLTLHSLEERNIETERSRSVSNPGRLQRIRVEDSGDFSAALQTVESFPLGSHENSLTAAIHTKDLMALN